MKGVKTLLLIGLFSWRGLGLVYSQKQEEQVILYDDFFTRNGWTTDLTLTYPWSEKGEVVSGFDLGETADLNGLKKQCLRISPEALSKPGYKPGTMLAGLAVDYRFETPVERNHTTLKIEFDALWEGINNSGWGESGRIVLTLIHDYPEDSIAFNTIFDVKKEAPLGRPAYNLRIRNHDKTGPYYSGSFLLYGGGMDKEGEFEKYQNTYWLPGFSSEPGGTSPGLLPSFPASPTMKNEQIPTVAYPFWKHYTWIVKPERMEFYQRDCRKPESENELVFFMQIPVTSETETEIIKEINQAHQTSITKLPAMYNWFPEVDALRVYFRGEQQTCLANLKITAQETEAITTLKQVSEFQTVVYPNPSNGNFIITSRDQELKQIEIFTLNGTLIYTGKPENKISAYQVNATGLPNGIYLLRLTSHSLSKTLKITIH